VVELNSEARLHLLADPGDVGVDLLVAAPGIPVDRLAARLGQRVGPGIRRRRSGCQGAERKREQSPQHDASPSVADHCLAGKAPGSLARL
jgi:hypothetical protein